MLKGSPLFSCHSLKLWKDSICARGRADKQARVGKDAGRQKSYEERLLKLGVK
jgi:hypothetical protein